MYKFVADTDWQSITSEFPSSIGVTANTKSTISVGSKLFTYFADLITGSKVFGSDDNGNTWSETGIGLTVTNSTMLNDFLAASPSYLYC